MMNVYQGGGVFARRRGIHRQSRFLQPRQQAIPQAKIALLYFGMWIWVSKRPLWWWLNR
jgi:hypothetical protein